MKNLITTTTTLVFLFVFTTFIFPQDENKGRVERDRNDPPSKKALASYRELYFGSTTAEQAEELHPETLMCSEITNGNEITNGKTLCNGSHTIGDVYVENIIVFKEDVLTEVLVAFDPHNYGQLKEIFISKYGPPSSVKKSTVQNMMGVKLLQEECVWDGPTVHMTLSKYGSKVDTGLAYYITQSEFSKTMKDKDKAKKTAKDDF